MQLCKKSGKEQVNDSIVIVKKIKNIFFSLLRTWNNINLVTDKNIYIYIIV